MSYIGKLAPTVGNGLGGLPVRKSGSTLDKNINKTFLNAGIGITEFCITKSYIAFISIDSRTGILKILDKSTLETVFEYRGYIYNGDFLPQGISGNYELDTFCVSGQNISQSGYYSGFVYYFNPTANIIVGINMNNTNLTRNLYSCFLDENSMWAVGTYNSGAYELFSKFSLDGTTKIAGYMGGSYFYSSPNSIMCSSKTSDEVILVSYLYEGSGENRIGVGLRKHSGTSTTFSALQGYWLTYYGTIQKVYSDGNYIYLYIYNTTSKVTVAKFNMDLTIVFCYRYNSTASLSSIKKTFVVVGGYMYLALANYLLKLDLDGNIIGELVSSNTINSMNVDEVSEDIYISVGTYLTKLDKNFTGQTYTTKGGTLAINLTPSTTFSKAVNTPTSVTYNTAISTAPTIATDTSFQSKTSFTE